MSTPGRPTGRLGGKPFSSHRRHFMGALSTLNQGNEVPWDTLTSAPALRWVLDREGFAVGAVLAGILAGTGCRMTVVSSLTGVAPTSGGTSSAGAGATSGGGRSSTGGTGRGASAGGGSTTGPALCGPGRTWAGDSCVAEECADFANFPCLLAHGGLGVCVSGACLDLDSDPSNCGTYGRKCPPDTVCFEGLCILHDGGLASCEPPYIPQLYPTSFGETDGPLRPRDLRGEQRQPDLRASRNQRRARRLLLRRGLHFQRCRQLRRVRNRLRSRIGLQRRSMGGMRALGRLCHLAHRGALPRRRWASGQLLRADLRRFGLGSPQLRLLWNRCPAGPDLRRWNIRAHLHGRRLSPGIEL